MTFLRLSRTRRAAPMPSALLSVRLVRATFASVTAALLLAAPQRADAQFRRDSPMGFYTTTARPTLDIEVGGVTSSTVLTESPSFAAGALFTLPVVKLRKKAIIAGVRGTALELGRPRDCLNNFENGECRSRRYAERASVLVGGAFDIRSTILRVMVGPVLQDVEGTGARIGTQVRADYATPRLRGMTPTLFVSRSMMGSEQGRGVGITALGIGFRKIWKEKPKPAS
ncbi:MAG: hypothetical protein LCH84_02085 [Gemmatimonadetes bacterium]|nr:hypothetical protein [Gemmatimonadota bacterium]